MIVDYLMESEGEAERLRDKTDYSFSKSNLTQAGLKPGMASIDVGCGIGLVTSVMHEMTGGGTTLGVDASEERIQSARRHARSDSSLSFLQADARQIPLEDDGFDFAWSRFLFEYLPDPIKVLREMIRLTRPGGRIAVADLDGQMLGFYPQSDWVSDHLSTAMRLLRGSFDPFVGRKLYSLFKNCGLRDITATVIPYQTYCGGLPPKAEANWRSKLSTAEKRLELLDPSRDWKRFSQAMLNDLNREDGFYYSTLVLACGVKA